MGTYPGPDWVQSDVAQRLGLKPEDVTVNMTFLGGGFGRKAFTDYTYEAVVISKEIKGPVQVVWAREDDMTQGPFRPGATYGMKAGISKMATSLPCRQKWRRRIWITRTPAPIKHFTMAVRGRLSATLF